MSGSTPRRATALGVSAALAAATMIAAAGAGRPASSSGCPARPARPGARHGSDGSTVLAETAGRARRAEVPARASPAGHGRPQRSRPLPRAPLELRGRLLAGGVPLRDRELRLVAFGAPPGESSWEWDLTGDEGEFDLRIAPGTYRVLVDGRALPGLAIEARGGQLEVLPGGAVRVAERPGSTSLRPGVPAVHFEAARALSCRSDPQPASGPAP